MADPPALASLIARLQAASWPDRELDAAIAALCAPTDDPRLAAFESGDDYPRNYTSSLDAALALVPEGWTVSLDIDPKQTACEVIKPIGRFLQEADIEIFVVGKTPALALCLAALKARLRAPG